MKELQPTIKKVSKIIRLGEFNYDQTKRIFEGVRKTLGLKPPKRTTKGTVKRMSQKELEQFLIAAWEVSSDCGILMQFLYDSACRVAEFCDLRVNDVYFESKRVVIQEGKGGKRREIPISTSMVHLLQSYLKERKHGALFWSNRKNKFTTRRIQQIVAEVGENAEISWKITPHVLRHTRATKMAEDGMPKDYIQTFLGHEHSSTTEIYTKTANLPFEQRFRELYDK